MTTRSLQAGAAALLLTLAACAHRVPPAPVPQAPVSRAPAPATAPPAPAAAPVRFTATAYCLTGLTATGDPVSKGVVAADPAVLPLGTVIRISGAASYDGTYRVLDTGANIRRHRVDLFVPDCGAARRFGRRPVHVTIVRKAR
jgi:3D (Asp-Asp-Asp) domain-containing protein